MRLRFGTYAGKSTEVLLLRAPDYADWVLRHRPEGALGRDFSELVAAFDARPLEQACACGAPARHVLAYRNSTELLVLCDRCAAQPSLRPVTSEVTAYAGALEHVRETCVRAHRKAQRRIIRRLAAVKGLPQRITQAAAEAFLSGVCADPPSLKAVKRPPPDRSPPPRAGSTRLSRAADADDGCRAAVRRRRY